MEGLQLLFVCKLTRGTQRAVNVITRESGHASFTSMPYSQFFNNLNYRKYSVLQKAVADCVLFNICNLIQHIKSYCNVRISQKCLFGIFPVAADATGVRVSSA
jgi:hypothetical protein